MYKPQYCIVVTYDSCEPMVYGCYKSKIEAEKAEQKIRNGFDDYERNHHESVTIRHIHRKGV